MDCENGCLFNVNNDITEHLNIANENTEIVKQLSNELKEAKKTFYSNNEKGENACPNNVTEPCACWMAKNYLQLYFGPYQYFAI